MNRLAGDEIVAKTGGPASFNHGPKILWWKNEKPAVFRSIHAFVQPGGYAAMRLCGLGSREAFIDSTYLHFSGFADTIKCAWDAELCQRFGIPPEKLPRIVSSHEVIGELTGLMARRCGLKAGIPVVAGCGDTMASFLACGATREGISIDVAGTASVFAATTKSFKPDVAGKVLSTGHAATPGLWHPYAYINGGGFNLQWFTEHIAGIGSPKGISIDQMDRSAGAIRPLASLPIFVPHLGGRVCPSWPKLRGAWAGLSWSHSARELWFALLEGVALEYALYRNVLAKLYRGIDIREVRVTGGGQKSIFWSKLKANALQVPIVQVSRAEGAPLGCALLGAYGVGLVRDIDQAARDWIRVRKTCKPNPELADHYRERLDRYERLLDVLNAWNESSSRDQET